MNKKLLSLAVLAGVSVVALGSCGAKGPKFEEGQTGGKVLNIHAWNDEFQGFFNKYVSDEKNNDNPKEAHHYKGVEVKWTFTPSNDGQYQDAMDLVLDNQDNLPADERVDMFLAEADYITKYVEDEATTDVTKIGVTDFSNIYDYTKQACTDSKGAVKGVSFQCCPSALIYNRVVAKAVLGSDDPEVVGGKLDTWDKFNKVAADAKEKGYYMTACEGDTFRLFSNNASTPWVNSKNELSIPAEIQQWMDLSEDYVKNGYTQTGDVWSDVKKANIAADANKALCTFGPAWYYNFCMGDSKPGDWGVVKGPMAHFWGGTWLLASSSSDNLDLVGDIMNAFINDETVCKNLITNDGQFTNNKKVNEEVANDPNAKGNAFLNGQNDTKLYVELAKGIKMENNTIYDQLCNEGIQKYFREYLDKTSTKEAALNNFYDYIQTKYKNIKLPK